MHPVSSGPIKLRSGGDFERPIPLHPWYTIHTLPASKHPAEPTEKPSRIHHKSGNRSTNVAKNEPEPPNTHAVSEVNSLITPVHHLQHTAIPWSNSLTTSRARQEADTQHAVPIAFFGNGRARLLPSRKPIRLNFLLQTNCANHNRPLTRRRSQNISGSGGTSDRKSVV